MKYKVIDLHSNYQYVQTGTCDFCFGTAYVDEGSLVLEDENKNRFDIDLTVWDWGDYDTIDIDNVVDFSAWLQTQDVEPLDNHRDNWAWLDNLVRQYDKDKKGNWTDDKY